MSRPEHAMSCPAPYSYCTCGAPGSLMERRQQASAEYERGKREGIEEGIEEGRRLEREAERARVVAYLARKGSPNAGRIERGEHIVLGQTPSTAFMQGVSGGDCEHAKADSTRRRCLEPSCASNLGDYACDCGCGAKADSGKEKL